MNRISEMTAILSRFSREHPYLAHILAGAVTGFCVGPQFAHLETLFSANQGALDQKIATCCLEIFLTSACFAWGAHSIALRPTAIMKSVSVNLGIAALAAAYSPAYYRIQALRAPLFALVGGIAAPLIRS